MMILTWLIGIAIIALVFWGCWKLADLVIPESEIRKIEEIGEWAKGELDKRGQTEEDDFCSYAERRTDEL